MLGFSKGESVVLPLNYPEDGGGGSFLRSLTYSLDSTQASTKQKGIELCLLFVEMEEDMGEGVIVRISLISKKPTSPFCSQRLLPRSQGDVVPGLDVKQPKVVAGCVTVLKELV